MRLLCPETILFGQRIKEKNLMKKFTSLFLLALMVLTNSPAVLQEKLEKISLRPLNVQNAYIDTESDKKYELRVNFDWFRTSQGIGGRRVRTNSFNLPRLEVKEVLILLFLLELV